MNADDITILDGVVLAILLVGIGRGMFIGMIRESFSIAAFGSSCIALRYGNEFAAHWLTEITDGQIGSGAAPWITGAVIMVGTVSLIGFAGRYLKRGAQAVGLGWADRLGGGALGMAEGALLATLIVLGATFTLGRDHSVVQYSHSVDAVDYMREYVVDNADEIADELPDVAAPLKRGLKKLR